MNAMKTYLFFSIILSASSLVGQTKVELTEQVKGALAPVGIQVPLNPYPRRARSGLYAIFSRPLIGWKFDCKFGPF